jgi:hypothetical protein
LVGGIRFGGPRHGARPDPGNDLTMVAGSRKVHLAPRGRERRKAGPDPGSHQHQASTKLYVRNARLRKRRYADGSGISEWSSLAFRSGLSGPGADLTGWKYRVSLKSRQRGTERKFRNTVSACFLRTQQRAKSQCMNKCTKPPSRRVPFGGSRLTDIAMMYQLMVG